MDAAKPAGDVNELLARMQRVRACGYYHAEELHSEAKRLVDWKEYVRSKPLMSIAVASLVGFSIVRSTFGAKTQTMLQLPSRNTVLENSRSCESGQSNWKNGATTLITSIASTAAKYFVMTLLQPQKTDRGSNDRFQKASSEDQSMGAAQ